MTKYLHISVPQPCHEGWEDMTPADRGRYCSSCQKTVIDFSMMTDAQLLEFFSRHKKDVCGRFSDDQLARPIPVPVKRIPWLTYFFKITIPAFLFTAKAVAQDVIKPRIEQVEPGINKKESKEDLPLVVSGMVTDSAGKPIAHASVIVANTNIGVPADEHGRFSLTLQPGQRVLNISAVGFKPGQYSVNNAEEIRITLKEDKGIMGDLILTSEYQRRLGVAMTCFVTFINEKLPTATEDSITIFPNPVQRNSTLTIRWKKPVSSDQSVEVYTFSGALLQREMIRIRNKTKEATTRLEINAAGVYLIRITDMKSGRVEAKQLVVE